MNIEDHHKVLSETSDGRYTPEEILELEQGFGMDAFQQEQEEKEANENGFCIHCGEDLEKCTGYKCWI
jgi:hypothetical protein